MFNRRLNAVESYVVNIGFEYHLVYIFHTKRTDVYFYINLGKQEVNQEGVYNFNSIFCSSNSKTFKAFKNKVAKSATITFY